MTPISWLCLNLLTALDAYTANRTLIFKHGIFSDPFAATSDVIWHKEIKWIQMT